MNWKKKDKSAWAFLVPEISDYDFLPISNLIGKTALEYLFRLNYNWQTDNFKFIQKMISESEADTGFLKNSRYDFYIFSKKNQIREFDGYKIHLRKKIPVMKNKTRYKINLSEIPGSENSSAGKLKAVFHHLLEHYGMVTVWNLESLLLEPAHFLQIFSSENQTGVLRTFTSFQNRLVLLSFNSKDLSVQRSSQQFSEKEFKIENRQICSLYDLSSIQETICHFQKQNSPVSNSRTGELAQVIKSIRLDFQ